MSDSSYQQTSQDQQVQDSPSDQQLQKPKKKLKRQKSESQDSQDSTGNKKKHKKHKKSKSKHKKHKEKSEKKNKKQKEKKSKHKKNHQKSDDEQSQIQEEPSSSHLLSPLQKIKSKRSKSNGSAKDNRSKTPSRLKKVSQAKVKSQAIVSASEDEEKPIELQKQDNDSYSDKPKPSKQKSERKKRGRKPRSQVEEKPQQQSFDIDDVINLEDEEESKRNSSKELSLSTRQAKKKIDRLTKIKQPVIKNIIVTKNVENVPVDHHFSKFNECRVFQMGGCFYNATLTQSNIVRDDNKFFIIQILQMNHNEEEFYVYSRWGRVGVTGQISQLGPLNRQSSIRHYNQVVQNKIKIGHYKVVEMNYDDYDKNKKQKGNKQLEISSKLDVRVQQLIKVIFDFRMMNSHMREIGYDEKRLPLGKLGEKVITQGYNTLNKLLAVINDKTKESFEKKKEINELSGIFYQCIPHDFGYINMQTFVLDTAQKVKEKLQILSSLQEIQIYNSLINEKISNPQLSEIDQKYFRLGVTISPIIKGSQVWKKLIKYVQNTHAKTHNKYDLQVQEIFELKKEEMDISYKKEISNKILLWHGSRLTNYVGIMSKGLKIAPLQAPSTGYMFGKGIYFADMVSKSANYCLASRINNIGLVLLCEVACGNSNQKFQPDFEAANLPEGMHSTKGMGQAEPNGGEYLDVQGPDGVWIPNGKAGPSGVVDSSLLYNEYVVYDPRQIRYRYLFRFKFHFKITENILPGIRV